MNKVWVALVVISVALCSGLGLKLRDAAKTNQSLSDLLFLSDQESEELRRQRDAALTSQRKALLALNKPKGGSPQPSQVEAPPLVPEEEGRVGTTTLSFADFQRAAMEGNLTELLALLTPEAIDAILEKYERHPDLLLAASLHVDPHTALTYVNEVLAQSPHSVAALMRQAQLLLETDQLGPEARESIDKLRALDPTNALCAYYDAIWHLENGDFDSATAALQEGSGTGRLQDYSLHHLLANQTLFWEVTGTESVAQGLATMGSNLSATTHLNDFSITLQEEAKHLAEQGRPQEAIALHEELARLGRKMSSSGWGLVQELSGTRMTSKALESLRPLFLSLGDSDPIEELDRELLMIQRRMELLRKIALNPDPSVPSPWDAPEDILVEFFDRVTREGEVSAFRWLMRNAATGEQP